MDDVLEGLISLSDSLDKRGYHNISDDLDSIINKISASQVEAEESEKEELRLIATALLESLED